MAGYSVDQILAPLAIVEKISTIDFPGTVFQRLFGWSIASFAGPNPTGNSRDWPLRTGQYDIFNVTRRIGTASIPGTAPTRIEPQKVGEVQFTIPRLDQEIELKYEDLNNRRVLGGPASEIDRNGLRYINNQVEYMAQQVANMIEFQTAAMCRGSYSFYQNGSRLEQVFSGGTTTVNYQIPAGNLTQLNMTGAGNIITSSWATPSTDIPGQLIAINAALLNLTGQGLEDIVCRGQTWNNVLNNTNVKAQGGTANTAYETYDRKSAGEFSARLKCAPQWAWHIVDYGLEIFDGSSAYPFTTLLPDDGVVFMPKPESRWVEYIRGMETVVEGPNGPKSDQYGFYGFGYPINSPAGWRMETVFNGLPALLRPSAIAFADTTP